MPSMNKRLAACQAHVHKTQTALLKHTVVVCERKRVRLRNAQVFS